MESNTTSERISIPAAIIVAGALIAGALLYAFVYVPKQQVAAPAAAVQQASEKDIPAVSNEDHRRGGSNPKLTLVEYSDLECPFCSSFHPVINQITEEYGDQVAWVYRHFPLTQIHAEAFPAAEAAECVASLKGNDAFWRFIDGVFAGQATIGTDLYHALAGKEGIAIAEFDACMNADTHVAKIQQQFNDAVASGGTGTPYTVILNAEGKTVGAFPGALKYPQMKAQIETLLKQ